MKFIVTLLLLCAVAGLALASGSDWSDDSTTTEYYYYYDPSSTTQASVTTEAPQSPCGGNILRPCGKFGGKKLYFFY